MGRSVPRRDKSPAFQFYPADYLSDANVALMSLEAQGAYIRLLCHCWIEGKLPSDPERLATLSGCYNGNYDWESVWPQIEPCFRSDGRGGLYHPRLRREIAKQKEWRSKSSRGGIASGKARRRKKLAKGGSDLVEPKSNRTLEPNANTSSSSSSSSSDSRQKKPPSPPAADAARKPDDIEKVWNGYLEARTIYYRDKNGRQPPSTPDLTAAVRKLIREALRMHGYEKSWGAGRGIFLSDFHTGKNDEGKEYLGSHLPWRINRDGDNVERFSELYYEARRRYEGK